MLARVLGLLLASSLALEAPNSEAQSRPQFSQPELERMLAPIALYPDAVLAQILLAATWPADVIEAARWSREHPGLEGEAAVRAAAGRNWDPSVRALVAFPELLARMAEDPDWTVALGDAFLAQEPHVMDAVQVLRQRARAAGTLASDEHIRVTPSGSSLLIAPAQPQIVYLPYYDPWVAYGLWHWPAYPPVRWAPWPGYRVVRPHPHHAPHAALWWGRGIGVSAGFFFGTRNAHQRQVTIVNPGHHPVRAPAIHGAPHAAHPHRIPDVVRHEPLRHGAGQRHAEVQVRAIAPAIERRAEHPHAGQRAAPSIAPALSVAPAVQQVIVQPLAPRGELRGQREAVQPTESARRAPPPEAREQRREARQEHRREHRRRD